MLDHEAMNKRIQAVYESFPTEAEAAKGLHSLGQIMSGKIQLEEQSAMTIDELRVAKHHLQKDINNLLDRFQQEAGAGVWVAGIDLEHMEQIGHPAPTVAAVRVDVRLRYRHDTSLVHRNQYQPARKDAGIMGNLPTAAGPRRRRTKRKPNANLLLLNVFR